MDLARRWVLIALANLILAATLGLILRYAFVVELSWMKYSNVLHAHSHMAMLGWGYLAVFALFYSAYREYWQGIKKTIHRLFILLEIAALGLFICFPLYGYELPTIVFLTAHMLLSYYFVYTVWNRFPDRRTHPGSRWAKAALVFLLLSTLGVWFVAPIYAFGLGKTIWYYLAVQFFLHFEINAWFLFAAMALFFIQIRKTGIELPGGKMDTVFYLFFISAVLTYALSVAWSRPTVLVRVINTSGVILQAAGALLLFRVLWPKRKKILSVHDSIAKPLFLVAVVSFTIKIIIQLTLTIPALMEVAYTIRNFIIGFIHLILLGIFTAYVLSILHSSRLLPFGPLAKTGSVLFIFGYISSELIIFTQGGMFWMAWGFMPFYYTGLTLASLFLPVGLILILAGMIYQDRAEQSVAS